MFFKASFQSYLLLFCFPFLGSFGDWVFVFFVLEIMKGAVVQAVVDRVEDGDKEKKKKQRRRRSKQNSSTSGTLINFPFFFFPISLVFGYTISTLSKFNF